MKKLLFLGVIAWMFCSVQPTFSMIFSVPEFLANKTTTLVENPEELRVVRQNLATMLEIGNYPRDPVNEAYQEFVLCADALNEVSLSICIEILDSYSEVADKIEKFKIRNPDDFANNRLDFAQEVESLFNSLREFTRSKLLHYTNTRYDSKILRRAPNNFSLNARLQSLQSTVRGARQVLRKVSLIQNIVYYVTAGTVTITAAYLFKKDIWDSQEVRDMPNISAKVLCAISKFALKLMNAYNRSKTPVHLLPLYPNFP